MYKAFRVLFFIFFTASINSCSDNGKEEEQKAYDEVMNVHNDAMPKMAELQSLKRSLKAYKDIVPDEKFNQKDSLINGILLLSKANDNMMNWMANWKYPHPEFEHEQEMKYLIAQKDSIKAVSDNIYMGIAVATGLLNNAPDSLKAK